MSNIKDTKTQKGSNTYNMILRKAVDIASIEGLNGVSIGRLASELNMSKSGLFAHFGSKEQLQSKIIDIAAQIFNEEVIKPAESHQMGLHRLWSLMDNWISYLERKVFPGGCFFSTVTIEYDCKKGELHEKIGKIMSDWRNRIINELNTAKGNKQIIKDADIYKLAFEIISIGMGANWIFNYYNDKEICMQARKSILDLLNAVIIDKSIKLS